MIGLQRTLLRVLAGLALTGFLVAPALASVMKPEVSLRINGAPFEGKWTTIGDRIYVGVESLARALGYPRRHNVKGWCLGPEGNPCEVSPLELAVDAAGQPLPVVRHGGVTMVDLKEACRVLHIPFHYHFASRTYQVGSPYLGEAVKGAVYRWHTLHYNWHGMTPYGRWVQLGPMRHYEGPYEP